MQLMIELLCFCCEVPSHKTWHPWQPTILPISPGASFPSLTLNLERFLPSLTTFTLPGLQAPNGFELLPPSALKVLHDLQQGKQGPPSISDLAQALSLKGMGVTVRTGKCDAQAGFVRAAHSFLLLQQPGACVSWELL
jgi:hypothetical protein